MTKTTSFIDTAHAVVADAEKSIKELESYFSVSCIDAWPFVIVLEDTIVLSALKSLGNDRYNFSAYGRDAMCMSRAAAEANAKHFAKHGTKCKVMGKHAFYTAKLADHRQTADTFRKAIADLEAGRVPDMLAA